MERRFQDSKGSRDSQVTASVLPTAPKSNNMRLRILFGIDRRPKLCLDQLIEDDGSSTRGARHTHGEPATLNPRPVTSIAVQNLR